MSLSEPQAKHDSVPGGETLVGEQSGKMFLVVFLRDFLHNWGLEAGLNVLFL